MRLLLPIILVGAAIGLFMLYTNPTYQGTKSLQAQVALYDEALDKSKELLTVRDELLQKRNTFSTTSIQKLEDILPDNVDNIRLIIDINNIAAKHKLSLREVELGDVSGSRSAGNPLASGSSGDAVGSVDIGFSVVASYDTMLAFLQDVEHSLRLIDLEELVFQAVGADKDDYSFSIRTYWLH